MTSSKLQKNGPGPRDELVREALAFDSGEIDSREWSPVRRDSSEMVEVRIPVRQRAVVAVFADRARLTTDELVARWLDDRLRDEHARLSARPTRLRVVPDDAEEQSKLLDDAAGYRRVGNG